MSIIIEHPAVAEVAVIGKPDPERTEIVKAFVVLRRGYEPSNDLEADLQQHAVDNRAPDDGDSNWIALSRRP
jgi:acyl-coenzyme A synthetase/AMP-(fatty) acid ligase